MGRRKTRSIERVMADLKKASKAVDAAQKKYGYKSTQFDRAISRLAKLEEEELEIRLAGRAP